MAKAVSFKLNFFNVYSNFPSAGSVSTQQKCDDGVNHLEIRMDMDLQIVKTDCWRTTGTMGQIFLMFIFTKNKERTH